jgi:hypothetical protein
MATEVPTRPSAIQNTSNQQELYPRMRVEGKRYAWGKTGREMCSPHYKAARDDAEGDFVTVDLCSSTPMLSQIWREDHRRACYEESMRATGPLAQALDRKPYHSPLTSVRSLNEHTATELKNAFGPKYAPLRQLLVATAHEILHNPPTLKPWRDQKAYLAAYIKHSLVTSTNIYSMQFERERMIGRGRWQILMPVDIGVTFAAGVESIVGAENISFIDSFLDEVSHQIADHCLPRLRKFLAVSLDCDDPETIFQESESSFPRDYWNTEFFNRITDFNGHVVADVMPKMKHKDEMEMRRKGKEPRPGLPFRPGSVSFISSVEGWPFFFRTTSKKNHFLFAESVAEVLKPGGRAVFFPFEMWNQSKRDKSTLDQIKKYWKSMGMLVLEERVSGQELIDRMSDREMALTHLSPVFQRRHAMHTILILVKPRMEGIVQDVPPLQRLTKRKKRALRHERREHYRYQDEHPGQ